jgi:hypothetical protein
MILKAIMRYFSYVFHGVLALFSIAVAALALGTGSGGLHLGMLPWTGDTLNYVLLFGALFGLLTVALAIKGTLRILFLIWSFLVFVLLLKGYILSGYKFAPNEFRIALFLIGGALISLFGAWFQLQRPKMATKKY